MTPENTVDTLLKKESFRSDGVSHCAEALVREKKADLDNSVTSEESGKSER